MSEILEEFDKYVSSNKELLDVLPVNTKKNRSIYVTKVEELEEKAIQMKELVWKEIVSRYKKILAVEKNPEIEHIKEKIDEVDDIDLFNELNTSFEKLGLDRVAHSLGCFFEADLTLVNQNIKAFVDELSKFGISISPNDFVYSDYAKEYMTVFFEEMVSGDLNSEKVKKTFETIYWKCPDVVTHIELNLRYLYNINSKKIESDMNEKGQKILASLGTDKNGMVKRYFDLSKELIKLTKTDSRTIIEKFYNEEWKIKDFSEKQMSVLYDRLYTKDYYGASEEDRNEIDQNFVRLLNTLLEYNTYVKYKFILEDLKKKYKNKENLKNGYELKLKELHKKEQLLLNENKKNHQLAKVSKNPLLVFFKKKIDRKLYEAPVQANTKIKELKELYNEVDEETVNKRINQFVDDTCSLKYMFKIVISFYTYAYNLVKEQYKDDEDIDVTEELQGLIDFINQPYKVMLNNIKLVEEPEICSIISNRYKILNIKLESESLREENIDELIVDVQKIVDFYYIRNCGISLDDIEFMQKVKPMIEKNK